MARYNDYYDFEDELPDQYWAQANMAGDVSGQAPYPDGTAPDGSGGIGGAPPGGPGPVTSDPSPATGPYVRDDTGTRDQNQTQRPTGRIDTGVDGEDAVLGVDNMINRDWQSWEAALKAGAAANGIAYDPSDLWGVIRNVSYAQNAGKDPQEFINSALDHYRQRATNTPGGAAPQATAGSSARAATGGGTGLTMPSGFGDPPAPFGETYSTLSRPTWLQGEYVAPKWTGGDFAPPSMQDVQQEAGYQTGLNAGQQALERSAAANGSILSGGTQKKAARYATDYGATKYGESFNRAFQSYQQKYGQFQDSANRDVAARGVNETTYQNDASAHQGQYQTRYQSYLDAITNKRNSENDYWNRNMDLVNSGLTASGLARPS